MYHRPCCFDACPKFIRCGRGCTVAGQSSSDHGSMNPTFAMGEMAKEALWVGDHLGSSDDVCHMRSRTVLLAQGPRVALKIVDNTSSKLLICYQGEPVSILGRGTSRFSQVGFAPDDAAGRRSLHSALLHTHLILPSSSLKSSLLKGAQIPQLNSTMHNDRIRPGVLYSAGACSEQSEAAAEIIALTRCSYAAAYAANVTISASRCVLLGFAILMANYVLPSSCVHKYTEKRNLRICKWLRVYDKKSNEASRREKEYRSVQCFAPEGDQILDAHLGQPKCPNALGPCPITSCLIIWKTFPTPVTINYPFEYPTRGRNRRSVFKMLVLGGWGNEVSDDQLRAHTAARGEARAKRYTSAGHRAGKSRTATRCIMGQPRCFSGRASAGARTGQKRGRVPEKTLTCPAPLSPPSVCFPRRRDQFARARVQPPTSLSPVLREIEPLREVDQHGHVLNVPSSGSGTGMQRRGKRSTLRKPADKRQCPVRLPRAKIQGGTSPVIEPSSPWWEASFPPAAPTVAQKKPSSLTRTIIRAAFLPGEHDTLASTATTSQGALDISHPVTASLVGSSHRLKMRRVGRKAVQCWDMEIGCTQPARSVYVYFSLWLKPRMTAGREELRYAGSAQNNPLAVRDDVLARENGAALECGGGGGGGSPGSPPVSGIAWRDSRVRRCGGGPAGIEPGSPRWKACDLTTTPAPPVRRMLLTPDTPGTYLAWLTRQAAAAPGDTTLPYRSWPAQISHLARPVQPAASRQRAGTTRGMPIQLLSCNEFHRSSPKSITRSSNMPVPTFRQVTITLFNDLKLGVPTNNMYMRTVASQEVLIHNFQACILFNCQVWCRKLNSNEPDVPKNHFCACALVKLWFK
ncbi:hypothetical protein PR048_005566 [Dryococelus australis]|uniref:Uncharacterized protein n=1 Tax=Dryococelus australis TaxID=614101 RepID=A0ABQ9I8L5_9NEOP|nr:hypothetical protein PR048_005566 [Dryococelus australis]